ncbi:MAG: DUF3841 domain-containing protein [Chloroflexi bacterium]|nr:DUF3841 domain-containing protein [Chloroflexota bacterium]
MRIWTIQPVEVLARLEAEQVLYADPAHIWPEFRGAYDWLAGQMQRRIPGYGGGYPWWGWYNPKPDLRGSGHLPRGTRGVRLELELDPAQLLLSDFDAWHIVLNQGYLALTEAEDEAWDARFRAAVPDSRAWPPSEPWHSEILASWERIFDLEALAASEYWGAGARYVQTTFETLRLADVRERIFFVAR